MKKLTPIFLLSLLFLVPKAGAASFPDLYETHPNEDAFKYLKEQGTFTGFPDGTIKPEDRIERAQLAAVISRSLFSEEEITKCTDPGFPDVPAGQWFSNHICMMRTNGIMEGYPNGNFDLTSYVNFAEAAKIVAEANKVTGTIEGTEDQWYQKYVEALEERNAIPSTIDSFDEDATRGDIAEMEYRIEAKVTDQVSKSYEEIAEVLPKISSCAALEEKMTDYHNRPYYYGPGVLRGGMEFDDMAMPEAAMENSAGMAAPSADASFSMVKGADDYSQTNLQVEGVDEADIIKNDGKYIYIIKDDTVRIVEAYPPKDMKEVAEINFNNDDTYAGFYPQEMYVTQDRLIVMGQANNYYYPMADTVFSKLIAPTYNKQQNKVYIYDISDKSKPKLSREVTFDGYYQNSRMIGDNLYLVLNASPDYWNWNTADSGEDFLPMYKDGNKAETPMVECTGIRYFPGAEQPQYLITAGLNVKEANSTIDREVFLGNSENVYVSPTDLFVMNTYVDREDYTDWNWATDEAKSHAYRFALKDGDITFMARTEVLGRILNQFSMDQYRGNFRVATTSGDTWSDTNTSKNNVYTFDLNMKPLGKLEGLAPGERIYSTRFAGDRLYMVTFEQVDPFFVIDLENASSPKVLGELKLPGFSEYLHPYDENHIIGFGQETSVTEREGEDGADDSVSLEIGGFKMTMFDVTDVNNPKAQFTERIGDSGTYSELLYNHKALLFDKEKGLLAFPLTEQKVVKPGDAQCSQYTMNTCPYDCIQACIPDKDGECADVKGSCVAPTYEQYRTTFSGAVVYNVDLEDGFDEVGRISHMTDKNMEMGEWYDYNKTIQRILYIGEYLYTVAQGGVKASNLSDTKEVDMLELEGGYDYYDEVYPVMDMETVEG